MDKQTYTKLSALVDDTFTVDKAFGYQFKCWDPIEKKMDVKEKWQEGYTKVYTLDTDKGKLDVRAGQMGNLLEAVVREGRADIVGRTFSVKSNGKTGMDIRYYINAVKDAPAAPQSLTDEEMEDIPF